MSRAFISFLKKDALTNCIRELGLGEEGTVEEMRSKLRSYLDKNNIPSGHLAILEKLRSTVEELKVPSGRVSRAGSPSRSHEGEDMHSEDFSEVCDKVRKWGIKYDGGKDPLGFLERIEELATCYLISKATLLNVMPELLKGDALSWYRNNKEEWESYEDFLTDFKLYFLPPRFFENLEDDIRNRKQRANENFVDYVTSIQTLMRISNLSNKEQLERIYSNCRPEYKMYIKRRDFVRLRQLVTLAQEFESIRAEEIAQKKSVRHLQTAVATHNRGNRCFRCGEPGHTRNACSNPQNLFCWDCGKEGLRTIDCCRRQPGNAQGGPPSGNKGADL